MKCEMCGNEYPSMFYFKTKKICDSCYRNLPPEKRDNANKEAQKEMAIDSLKDGINREKVIQQLIKQGWLKESAVEFVDNIINHFREETTSTKTSIRKSFVYGILSILCFSIALYLIISATAIDKNQHNEAGITSIDKAIDEFNQSKKISRIGDSILGSSIPIIFGLFFAWKARKEIRLEKIIKTVGRRT